MNHHANQKHHPLFSIKPITEADVQGYRQVLDAVAKERKYLSFFEAPSLEATNHFVKNNIHGQWPHLIAIADNQIVGWCDITSLDRPIFNHVGVLGIGILASYRGLGIGKALMLDALQKAKARGLTRIELSVRASNTSAIHLYQKLGFKIEGVHIHAVCINGIYDNHISMALLF